MSDVVERCRERLKADPYYGYERQGTGLHNAYLTDVADLLEEIQRLRKALERLQDLGCQSEYRTCLERYPNNRNMWCSFCVSTKALKGEEK